MDDIKVGDYVFFEKCNYGRVTIEQKVLRVDKVTAHRVTVAGLIYSKNTGWQHPKPKRYYDDFCRIDAIDSPGVSSIVTLWIQKGYIRITKEMLEEGIANDINE